MAKYLYNGVLLPELPADVLAEYPYAWIRKNTTSGYYDLILSKKSCYCLNNGIYGGESDYDLWYRTPINAPEMWEQQSHTFGLWGLDTARTVLWSNHDIPNGSADSTEIYFYGSEPVDPNAPEEPTADVYYKVNGVRLTAIANAIRGKTGKEDSLTLEQMVTEIEDIKLQSKTVTPTDAEQTITADEGYFGLASVIVEAAEGGGIPENARLYYVGNAVSELSLNLASSATGELQEG